MSQDKNKQGALSAQELAAAILAAANSAADDVSPGASLAGPNRAHEGRESKPSLASTMSQGPAPAAKEERARTDVDMRVGQEAIPAAEDIAPVGWQAPLIDVLAAVVRKKWLVILFLGIGCAAGIYRLEVTPPYFRASCVALLLPREKPNLDVSVSTSSMETGMDSAKRGSSGPLMLPPNTDLYTTILMSRPVLLAIATKFGEQLQEDAHIPKDDRSDDVVDRIKKMLKISGTDEGMITIEVTANNNLLASNMANEFLFEMERASKTIEKQLILQQSGFLATAESAVKLDLQEDEKALADFYARHGVIDMSAQAADIRRMKREQKQEMYTLEQELMTRLTNYTENDETVATMRSRIAQHRERIQQLSKSYLDFISQEDYGQVRIKYDGLREQVRYKRDLLATISTQQSIFKIRAEQPAGSVAVLKSATPAVRPAGPSTELTLGLSAIGGLVAAIGLILVLEQWCDSVGDPYISRRIGEIRRTILPRWMRKLIRVVLWPWCLVLGIFRRRK